MSRFPLADRLAKLPPYLFAAIDKAKAEVQARGVDIISLGIGDPDLPTPDFIIEALHRGAKNPENHRYPSYVGMKSFRQAVADWFPKRFNGVTLDPDTEIVSLIGSKEGIAHFPLAYINPGDLALVCTPNYPVYPVAVDFAGGKVEYVPLTAENNYLPDLEAISADSWKKAKMIFINFPNNPTSAMADRAFFEQLVEKAREYNVIIVSDAAYVDVYFDPANKPLSILEIDGAREVAIEFHSLSKPFNMTGWRIGMAVGNESLIQGLGKIKENVDSGIFQAVQEAGIAALEQGEAVLDANRAIYMERRDAVVDALGKAGIDCLIPQAALYVWGTVPKGFTSAEFATDLLQKTGVVVTPGSGFGIHGEGFFRISLTVPTDRLKEAVSRIASL